MFAGALMNECPAAIGAQHDESEGELEASMVRADMACEECGGGADGMGGCKLTCSLADVPHPTRRKLVARSGIEDWQRWADARGSGLRERTAPDMRGTMGGTQRALARANMLMFCCPACDGLTELRAARQAARRQGRLVLLATDGCYGCGPNARPGKLSKAQRGKAHAALHGAKILIVRPQWADERKGLVMLSGLEAHQAVDRAIAVLPESL